MRPNISIQLPYGMVLSGLKALDARRRLGLPDDFSLRWDHVSPKVDVDEAFMRMYFSDDSSVSQSRKIDFSWLIPQDVGVSPSGESYFQLNPSNDRVRELFIRAFIENAKK